MKYIVAFFVYGFLVFPKPVYAYIDPGTGSYFFQIVIGFLFGAMFLVKTFWKKILTTIHSIKIKRKTS